MYYGFWFSGFMGFVCVCILYFFYSVLFACFLKEIYFFSERTWMGLGGWVGGDVGRIWKELEEGKPHQNSLYEKTVFTKKYILKN